MLPRESEQPVVDVTPAYRLWDDLFGELLRLGLATPTDDPRERAAAVERLGRGLARSFAERDAMWERALRTPGGAGGG